MGLAQNCMVSIYKSGLRASFLYSSGTLCSFALSIAQALPDSRNRYIYVNLHLRKQYFKPTALFPCCTSQQPGQCTTVHAIISTIHSVVLVDAHTWSPVRPSTKSLLRSSHLVSMLELPPGLCLRAPIWSLCQSACLVSPSELPRGLPNNKFTCAQLRFCFQLM